MLPGLYTVRITAGSLQDSTTVRVQDDPRINVSLAVRLAHRDALLGLGGLMARLDQVHQTAEGIKEQLGLLSESLEDIEVPDAVSSLVESTREHVDDLEARLARSGGFGGATPRPLSSRMTRVYRNLASYTESPNAFQLQRVESYNRELEDLVLELNQLIANEIATLNSTIDQQGIQRIVIR